MRCGFGKVCKVRAGRPVCVYAGTKPKPNRKPVFEQFDNYCTDGYSNPSYFSMRIHALPSEHHLSGGHHLLFRSAMSATACHVRASNDDHRAAVGRIIRQFTCFSVCELTLPVVYYLLSSSYNKALHLPTSRPASQKCSRDRLWNNVAPIRRRLLFITAQDALRRQPTLRPFRRRSVGIGWRIR